MYIHGHLLIQANMFYIKQSLSMIHDYVIAEIAEIGSDRGSGSTAALGRLCKDNHITFITIDIDIEAQHRAIGILSKISKCSYKAFCMDGKEYLNHINPNTLALLYLDAVDLGIKHCLSWHYEAAQIAKDKIVPGGFMCIDDTWWNKQWKGKGKFVVPFLISEGWRVISNLPRAILLQKPSSFSLPKYNKLIFWIQFIKYRYIKKWLCS